MLKEALRKIKDQVVPQVSGEMKDFMNQVVDGQNPEIPTHGKKDVIIDYYGRRRGHETGRLIKPWGDLERSFHVTRHPDGSFKVVDEGFFPNVTE